ncbi:MAG: carboxymuconolactone decarboxylase family protein [Psychroserpens sp.]|uniref:carboxymuconolactone decarboxylase family protein n=1 Tax=Psychroserpens sp. TaxID=2020870 RepID=UPI003003059F
MERISYQEVPVEIFEKLGAIEVYFENTSIDKQFLELLRLRISQMNGCAYCVDMHSKELKHLGETELRLNSLCVWQETPYFSKRERAALHFAELLTRITDEPLADHCYDSLLAFFSKEEICNLTLAISQINTWNRLMKVFRFTPGNYKVSE